MRGYALKANFLKRDNMKSQTLVTCVQLLILSSAAGERLAAAETITNRVFDGDDTYVSQTEETPFVPVKNEGLDKYNEAKRFLAKGDLKKAEDSFTELVNYPAYKNDANLGLVEVQIEKGDYSLADRYISAVLQSNPLHLEMRNLKVESLRKQKKFDEAKVEITKILKVAPNNFQARAQSAYILVDQDKTEEAIPALSKVISDFPKEQLPRLRRYQALYKLGKQEAALKDIESLVRENPHNVRLRSELVGLLLLMGNKESAEKELKVASSLAPQSIEVYERLGDLALINGKENQAADYYERVLRSMPGNPKVSIKLSRLYRAKSLMRESEEMLLESWKANPSNLEVSQELSDLYKNSQQYSKLSSFFEKISKKFPDQTWATTEYAQMLINVEEYKSAINVLEKNHSVTNPTLTSFLMLAAAYRLNGNFGDAKDTLLNALNRFDNEKVKFNLALAYDDLKKYDKALEMFATIASNSALYPRARVNTALTYEKMGELDKALGILREAESFPEVSKEDLVAKIQTIQSKMRTIAELKEKESGRSVASENKSP